MENGEDSEEEQEDNEEEEKHKDEDEENEEAHRQIANVRVADWHSATEGR